MFNDQKDRTSKTTPKLTPIRGGKKSPHSNMEVCVIKPTSVDDAREITETLLDNRTVVLNVEGLDVDIAQRIIDFSSLVPALRSAETCRRFLTISLLLHHRV